MPGLSRINSNALGNEDTGDVTIGPLNPAAYGGKLSVTNAGQASMFLWNAGIGSGHVGFTAGSSNLKLYNTYATGIMADGKGIDIDIQGRVIFPNQPRAVVTFSGTFSSKTYAANEQVIADLQNSNNTAGFYSTTTGLWTCPVAGWYMASAQLCMNPATTQSNRLVLRRNGADYNAAVGVAGAYDVIQPMLTISSSMSQAMVAGSCILYCAAGDTIGWAARAGSSVGPMYGGHSWMYCYLMG
jgi:hypothetical protein